MEGAVDLVQRPVELHVRQRRSQRRRHHCGHFVVALHAGALPVKGVFPPGGLGARRNVVELGEGVVQGHDAVGDALAGVTAPPEQPGGGEGLGPPVDVLLHLCRLQGPVIIPEAVLAVEMRGRAGWGAEVHVED